MENQGTLTTYCMNCTICINLKQRVFDHLGNEYCSDDCRMDYLENEILK